MMEFAGYFVFWKSVASGVITIAFWSAFTFAVFMAGLWIRSKIKRRK